MCNWFPRVPCVSLPQGVPACLRIFPVYMPLQTNPSARNFFLGGYEDGGYAGHPATLLLATSTALLPLLATARRVMVRCAACLHACWDPVDLPCSTGTADPRVQHQSHGAFLSLNQIAWRCGTWWRWWPCFSCPQIGHRQLTGTHGGLKRRWAR